ncbi:MAG: LD-carboxypeptidase [Bacteroidales bacterium]|nr:LD-carboxypeptidase [Bacteroidales bacterium]
MIKPLPLHKGDTIGLVAPARKISKRELKTAVEIIESRGYKIALGTHLFDSDGQFAGSDAMRIEDLREMILNSDIKAVMAVRGGYGSVRIVDSLPFVSLLTRPKWIIGYSDLTVFHNHINNMGVQTLHGSMPINFSTNTKEALDSLFDVLEGKLPHYTFESNILNRWGKVRGTLVGGNLSVLYSLLGSASFPQKQNPILFLEDLDEYLYHIDRMMVALKRSGFLKNLSGLIVGAMTDMHDNTVPFGKTAEQIIREAVEEYHFPVAFNFPAGHISDNRALIMGANVELECGTHSKLTFST